MGMTERSSTFISEMRDLLGVATPGPWTVEDFGNPDEFEIGHGNTDRFGWRPRVVSCGEPAEAMGISLSNALLIANARNHLEALLDVAEAAVLVIDNYSANYVSRSGSLSCLRAALGELPQICPEED